MSIQTLTIRSVLEESRDAALNEDGEYSCPFCAGYVRLPDPCGNPMCDAGRYTTVEQAEARRAERVRRLAEREERERRAEVQSRYSDEYAARVRAEREEWYRLFRDEGYCLTCLLSSHGRKRVRHRKDVHGCLA